MEANIIKKICFMALGAYGLLSENHEDELIGGAELQYTMMAEKLTEDFDVSFVVFDHGQKFLEEVNGIKIFKSFRMEEFLNKSIFRILYTSFKAFTNVNADIYITRSGKLFPSIVALYCFLHGKKFIYSFASDMDVRKNLNLIDTIIFKFILNRANVLLTQSEYQKRELRNNLGKESLVLKNMFSISKNIPNKESPPLILWVSTIKKQWKHPEKFLKIAKQIPEVNFLMIGGPSKENPEFFIEIKEKAQKIPNLQFLGFVPFKKINEYFSKASIFINTSDVEGFPNTFLQAWDSYTPVISLNIDPDEIICRKKLGLHSLTLKQMIADIKLLAFNSDLREKYGQNGKKYVKEEHDINRITNQFREILKKL